MDEITTDPKTQFNIKTNHIEITGGLMYGIGIAAIVEASIFYYGLFIIRFVIGPLFLDIEFFKNDN